MNKIEKIKLTNGLTIYLYVDKRKTTTFVNLVTKYGGSNKNVKIDNKVYHLPDGIAHLLEHFVVESNHVGDYLKLFGEKHMSANAYTSSKVTAFHFETLKDLEYGIDILLNSCYKVNFSKENLEKVKKPIYQEIRMYEDNKFYETNKVENKALYKNIDYRSISGNINDVKNVDINLLETVYKAFYHPDNQLLIVAGNFDKQKVLKQIKSIYEKLNFTKHDVEVLSSNEPDRVNKKKNIVYQPIAQEYAEIVYKINISDFTGEDLLKLDFYIHHYLVLAFGISSSCYKELIDKRMISRTIDIGTSILEDHLIINIGNYTSCPKKLIKYIKKVIKKNDFLDIDKYKVLLKRDKARVAVRKENIHSTISPFLMNVIEMGVEKLDSIELINSLNFTEFNEFINRLDFKNYITLIIKNNS